MKKVVAFPSYAKTVYILLLIIIIIFIMILAKPILVPLILGGYIAMLLTSLSNRLEKLRLPRSLSSFIATLLFVILVVGIFYLIIAQVTNFGKDLEDNLVENLNAFAISINASVQGMIGIDMGMGYGLDVDRLLSMMQNGEGNTSTLLLTTIGTLSTALLLPVFVFFLLIYRDHFAVVVTKIFENHKNKILLEHMVAIRKIVHSYLLGAGKVMLILGIICSAVLYALGIKHALFFGMMAGFLNIIPYLGPFLGAIMPFFFALVTKDSLFYPFAVVISFTLIQLIESAWLTPKITGSNVSLNAFVTFIGLLIGGAIWGVVGMIIIIPTIAILKKLFELNPETEPYAYLFGEENTRWFKRYKKLK